jgi:diguanylate cyclase (GGDEF)-like protein
MNRSEADKQRYRTRVFLMGALTYGLGYVVLILAACEGMLTLQSLLLAGAVFLTVNGALYAVFRSGLNTRFRDPSLTFSQVILGSTIVGMIALLDKGRLYFLATPFYSVLFVFAMLRLKKRHIAWVEAYVLATYGAVFAFRYGFAREVTDIRMEVINAAVVVLSSLWFAIAAGYVSTLRRRLRESQRTVEAIAIKDAVTGTWSRRHIDALLRSDTETAVQQGIPLCVCLLDIDHFKQVNDRWGHLAGDKVLQQVASGIQAHLRGDHAVGRFGGDEFLVLLPHTPLQEALRSAQRLCSMIAAMEDLPLGLDRITVSVGIAQYMPDETPTACLQRADRALYRVKNAGRNGAAYEVVEDVLKSA